MSNGRMDVLMVREYTKDGEKKTAFTKIGVAFPTKNDGYKVSLEAVPLPQVNDRSGTMEVVFLLMPPKDFGDGGGGKKRSHSRDDEPPPHDEKDIPF